MINYRWFKVFVIWETGDKIDFTISGVDENSVALTTSKLKGVRDIVEIREATKEEIPNDISIQ